MASELSRKVVNIMSREMGQLGKFIVHKQCKDLAIDPDEIRGEHLGTLAKALAKVMVTFGGEAKAQAVEREIRKLAEG